MAKAETNFKLIYFNAAGRAEPIRYLFASAQMVYDDCRLNKEEWLALKPSTPYGSLPVLEVKTGKTTQMIGQSLAIGRFVARLTGLYGKDDLEQALVDGVVDTISEMAENIVPIMSIDNEKEKVTKLQEFFEKSSVSLTRLEKFVTKVNENHSHFVGKKLTWADVLFFAIMEGLERIGASIELGKLIFDKFPKLKDVCDCVAKDQGIAKYKKKQEQMKKA